LKNKFIAVILSVVIALAACLAQSSISTASALQSPASQWGLKFPAAGSFDPTIAPSGVANVPVNTGFQWGAVSNTNYYSIDLADNLSFQNPISANVTNTVWSPGQNLYYNTTYYWRVRAVIGTNASDWTYSTFTTRAQSGQFAPIYTGSAISPAGVFDVPVNTGFQWSTIPNATSYEIQLADNSNFINAQYVKLNAMIWAPNQSLQPNTTYFWRIRAFVGNIAGGWADFTFTTSAQTASSTSPSATAQPTSTP
jgi:hypothetical protein